MNQTQQIIRQMAEGFSRLRATNPTLPMTSYERFLIKGHAGKKGRFSRSENCLLKTVWQDLGPFRKGQCYKNSQRVAVECKEFRYIEGYVSVSGVAIEHSWLELNAKVVDPTLDRAEHSYFGVEVPTHLIVSYWLKLKRHGPLTDDWDNGWEYARIILGDNHSKTEGENHGKKER